MAKRSKIVFFEDAKSRTLLARPASFDFERQDDPAIVSDVTYRDSAPLGASSKRTSRPSSNRNLSYVFEVDFENGGNSGIFADDAFDNPNLGITDQDIAELEDDIATPKKKSGLAKRLEEKKRSKNRAKADRQFKRALGSKSSDAAGEGGPRAALYKGEMGSSQRKATRLQSDDDGLLGKLSGIGLPSLELPKFSTKMVSTICALACIALFVGMLYTPAQQYYQQMRERDRLNAEYEAIIDRNESLQSLVDNLNSDEGIEDKAHAEFGLVKEGEHAGAVTGIDVVEESKFKANIAPGSIQAPDTWYSGILDVIFLYNL